MGYLISLVFFLLAAGAGAMLTTALPTHLELLERLAYGVFVGLILTLLLALGLGIIVGPGALIFWLGLVISLAAGTVVMIASGGVGRVMYECRLATNEATSQLVVPALVVAPWLAYFLVFFSHAYVTEGDGLYAGYVNIWGDWSAHLSFAGSFAFAHNLPPQFPILPGHSFSYPFMVDFFAAAFVGNGLSLIEALPFSSLLLAVSLVLVFYFTAARLAGDRLAGWFAPMIVLMGGGIGFLYLLTDLDRSLNATGDWLGFLQHLPREYTLDRDINYQWLNPVLAYIVPQRSVLFGIPVALMVMMLLSEALHHRSRSEMAGAGVLLGLTPLFHLHTVAALGLSAGVLMLVFLPWRSMSGIGASLRLWAWFWVPLLVLGLPVALMMLPHNPAGLDFLHFRAGWLANEFGGRASHDGFLWFWFKNLGLFIPLALVGFALREHLRPGLARFAASFWALFVIPNLLILQPWEWDNTKWFLFWYLASAVLIAATLAHLARRPGGGWKLVAGSLMLLLCATGAADLWRGQAYANNRIRLLTTEEVRLADWVRTQTPATAIFLTGDQHNHPVSLLGGRIIFKGYSGWLYTYHLDYLGQERVAQQIYDKYNDTGDEDRAALIRQYRIAYVVIGPRELDSSGMGAREDFFSARFRSVYRSDNYRIYQTG